MVGCLIWLLPSFTHRLFIQSANKEVRRPTDYLDGMRGVASLFVFFDHYLVGLYDSLTEHGYSDQNHWNVFELPFVKVFYSGGAMVSIFFVISGYVLSQRCVLAIRADNHSKLWSALTSMAFRRALRLFLPSIAISFVTSLVSVMGLLPHPNPHWTFTGECQRYWSYLMQDLFKVWDWHLTYGGGWYGYQLWTIPFEFMCSMALFMFILMVARCKIHVRFLVEGFTLTYLLYRSRWDVATFLGGMTIAEINAVYGDRQKTVEEAGDDEAPSNGSLFDRIIITSPLWILFVTGYYLAGYPIADAINTPGYDFLAGFWVGDWDYKRRFWLSIAAMMMVFSASFLKPLQRFFTTPIARYLGKISYPIYLVHGILNRTVRLWLWSTFWNILQYETDEGHDAKFDGGWIIGTLIYFPIVIWCADIFWRAADIPSVNFAKWVESKAFKGSKQA